MSHHLAYKTQIATITKPNKNIKAKPICPSLPSVKIAPNIDKMRTLTINVDIIANANTNPPV